MIIILGGWNSELVVGKQLLSTKIKLSNIHGKFDVRNTVFNPPTLKILNVYNSRLLQMQQQSVCSCL